jgi:hypothetical protein
VKLSADDVESYSYSTYGYELTPDSFPVQVLPLESVTSVDTAPHQVIEVDTMVIVGR